MSPRLRNAIKIAAAVALLVGIIAAYTVVNHNEDSGYKVKIVMADAGGLENGSNVNINGVTVGKVTNLYVTKAGKAVAIAKIDKVAEPIGSTATAQVQIDGFFGERIMAINRGNYSANPQPSGSTIPEARSSTSVRLDDVLDSLNMDAQGALRTFLSEEGTALIGRGQDLQTVLQELPQTLPQLTTLMSQFSANQQALGQLVDRSSQVVAQVAGQRAHLGDLINSGNSALAVLASRRDQLGQTVRAAPGALKQAQSTLATLQGTAIPLSPAADGLRNTAPSLLTALKEIPSFTKAAVPTLNEVSTVSPALDRLAAYGTPILSKIVPLTQELKAYSSEGLSPLLNMLANQGGAANLFGEMEGWARSTQGYDGSGHIFRFGATVGQGSFSDLLSALTAATPTSSQGGDTRGSGGTTSTKSPSSTGGSTGASNPVSGTVNNITNGVTNVVKNVTSGVSTTVNKVTGTVGGIVNKLGGHGQTSGSGSSQTSTQTLGSLLGYLLGK